jgi:hypothetical protein
VASHSPSSEAVATITSSESSNEALFIIISDSSLFVVLCRFFSSKKMRCIQCKNNTAAFEELGNAQKIYCGRACQKKHHQGLIGVVINDDDIITLVANDGIQFTITGKQSRRVKTIETLLDSVPEFPGQVPLPSVDGFALKWIVHYMKNGTVPTHTDFSDEEFDRLLKAANYLDFQDLLFYLYPEWVNVRFIIGRKQSKELFPLLGTAMYFFRGQIDIFSRGKFGSLYTQAGHYYDIDSVNWPLLTAVANGRLDVIEHLLQDKCLDPTTAIRVAVEGGHEAIVQRLLRIPRVDPMIDGGRVLRMAASKGNSQILALLLQDRRVDSSPAQIIGLFRAAVAHDKANIIDLLLQRQEVNFDNVIDEVLVEAVAGGHEAVVKRLLQDPRVDPTILEDIDDPEMQQLAAAQIKKRQRIQSRFIMAKAASHE